MKQKELFFQYHRFSACVDADYDIKEGINIFNKQCNEHFMNTFTINKACWQGRREAERQGRREAERAPGQYFDPGPFGIFSSTVYFQNEIDRTQTIVELRSIFNVKYTIN